MGKDERGKSLYVAGVDIIIGELPGTPKYKTIRWPEEGRIFRTRETKKKRKRNGQGKKKRAQQEKMEKRKIVPCGRNGQRKQGGEQKS